jgi:hypothetical protein
MSAPDRCDVAAGAIEPAVGCAAGDPNGYLEVAFGEAVGYVSSRRHERFGESAPFRMAEANARLVSANSWPFLSYSAGINTVDNDPIIHMRVYNTGVGPAKIESAELIWKGVPYRTDRDFLKACCDHDPAVVDFDSDLLMNEVLRANGDVRFLEFKQSANPDVFAKLKRVLLSRNLQLIVCYCSIFDECWKDDMTALSLTPARVKSCMLSKVPFDQGLLDRRP